MLCRCIVRPIMLCFGCVGWICVLFSACTISFFLAFLYSSSLGNSRQERSATSGDSLSHAHKKGALCSRVCRMWDAALLVLVAQIQDNGPTASAVPNATKAVKLRSSRCISIAGASSVLQSLWLGVLILLYADREHLVAHHVVSHRCMTMNLIFSFLSCTRWRVHDVLHSIASPIQSDSAWCLSLALHATLLYRGQDIICGSETERQLPVQRVG
ncbi:hypothetical protein GGI43DRAFT_167782 [Trichoderma evansii]